MVAPDCVVSSVEPNRCVAVHGTALMPNASTPPRSPPVSFQSKVVFGLASVLQYSIGCNFFPCHIFPHKMLHLGFERAWNIIFHDGWLIITVGGFRFEVQQVDVDAENSQGSQAQTVLQGTSIRGSYTFG